MSVKNSSKKKLLLEEKIKPLLDTDLNIRQTLSFDFEFQPFMSNLQTDRSCRLTKAIFTLLADSHVFPASSFIFQLSQVQHKKFSFSDISKEISVKPVSGACLHLFAIQLVSLKEAS